MSEIIDLEQIQFPAEGFVCHVFGQSGVGKSYLMTQIIANERWTFKSPPAEYHYVKKFEEKKLDDLKQSLGTRVIFYDDFDGLPFFEKYGFIKRNDCSPLICLVLDDVGKIFFPFFLPFFLLPLLPIFVRSFVRSFIFRF
jgi:hypothetical protein